MKLWFCFYHKNIKNMNLIAHKKNKNLTTFFTVLIGILLIYAINDAINNPDDFIKGLYHLIM